MADQDEIYRLLQQHLDKQAVGFPAARSGADIALLKQLFSPDEIAVALQLSYKPTPGPLIASRTAPALSPEQTEHRLESMFRKGAIGWKNRNGVSHWFLEPLVIGMYEAQDGNPTPEFLDAAHAYMRTPSFGKSFLAVKPPQMRTVPIDKSISAEHAVATYDQIRAIVQNSPGPFVALKCICREGKALRHQPCTKTSRLETCLAMGDAASMVLRRNHGHAITQDEALALLQQNEADGLVLQPANTQQPEFICSCCGCCCGMLSVHRLLPHPIDFWTTNFQAEVIKENCGRCGKCVSRCQVRAVTLATPAGKAKINPSRCIGCGLCVPTCPPQAIRLTKRLPETTPPSDTEVLYDEVKANKKSPWRQWCMLFKILLRRRQ
jgi:ferredoxin